MSFLPLATPEDVGMASAPIEPPGKLSCGVPTEVKMVSATVKSLGWESVTAVTSVTPLLH